MEYIIFKCPCNVRKFKFLCNQKDGFSKLLCFTVKKYSKFLRSAMFYHLYMEKYSFLKRLLKFYFPKYP